MARAELEAVIKELGLEGKELSMPCKCKIGPGKFEGEPAHTFMAWQQVMLGNADISTGSEGSLIDWLRSPLNLDADQSVVKDAKAYGYCAECIEAAGKDIRGGVAVWEDGHGFVGCKVFNTREKFDAALARELAKLSEEDEEESL